MGAEILNENDSHLHLGWANANENHSHLEVKKNLVAESQPIFFA